MFGFGNNNNNQKKPEEEEYRMTEQMLISNLPDNLLDKFVLAYQSMKKVSAILKGKNEDNVKDPTAVSDIKDKTKIRMNWKMLEDLEVNQKKIEKIMEESKKVIEGSLTLRAHRIDAMKCLYKERLKELRDAKKHYEESSHLRTLPSPFIKNFVENVEKEADEVTHSLNTYSSYFGADIKKNTRDNDYQFLLEEHESIVRCASRISILQKKLAATKDEVETRLKIDPHMFKQYEKNSEDTSEQLIRLRYKQFLASEKKKAETETEESDLFGNSTKVVKEQPKKTGFSFGTGSFGSSSFGNKSGNNSGTSLFGSKK